jgi:16S rRNA pseudouridine516 synthase
MTIRLDKYLAQLWLVSRRAIGKAVKSGLVCVDGEIAEKSDQKLSFGQTINFADQDIEVKESIYVLLHKPSGYVCSDIDEWWHASYKMLLQDCPYQAMLHVAGRLDFDTEWLVLCSNDGQFTHDIISPKKHLDKEYFVRTRDVIKDDDIAWLEEGVELDDGYFTLPAKAVKIDDNSLKLTIVEWKFHQVKRMLEAVWNEVTYLRRDRIWPWTLEGIESGKWKYIERN